MEETEDIIGGKNILGEGTITEYIHTHIYIKDIIN
jgi:hypothetical protein